MDLPEANNLFYVLARNSTITPVPEHTPAPFCRVSTLRSIPLSLRLLSPFQHCLQASQTHISSISRPSLPRVSVTSESNLPTRACCLSFGLAGVSDSFDLASSTLAPFTGLLWQPRTRRPPKSFLLPFRTSNLLASCHTAQTRFCEYLSARSSQSQ